MRIQQIKETSLYIQDLEKAFQFYHHELGFPLISRSEDEYVFFRAGSSVLLCFISESTRKKTVLPAHFGDGNQHLAFEVTPGDYKKWRSKISNAGITIIHEEVWQGDLESFYFLDPEDNVLEIVQTGMWD